MRISLISSTTWICRLLALSCLLVLTGCATMIWEKPKDVRLNVEQNKAILKDITTQMAEYFPPAHITVQLLFDENNSVQNNLLEDQLRRMGYAVGSHVDDYDWLPYVSYSITELTLGDSFLAGLSVGEIWRVDRMYTLSKEGNIVPSTGFNMRQNKQTVQQHVVKLMQSTARPPIYVNTVGTHIDGLKSNEGKLMKVSNDIKDSTQIVAIHAPSDDQKVDTLISEKPLHFLFSKPLMSDSWQVQIMAGRNFLGMLAAKEKLKGRGFESVMLNKKPFYLLRTGPYESKKAAKNSLEKLARIYSDAVLVMPKKPQKVKEGV
jgi:hypothetical protein